MNNLLTFEEALSFLRQGKFIGREDELSYFEPIIDNGELLGIVVHESDGDEWNVDDFCIDDILATDWIILE